MTVKNRCFYNKVKKYYSRHYLFKKKSGPNLKGEQSNGG